MYSKFKSKKRTDFFNSSGLPFWDGYYQVGEKKLPYAYLLDFCLKESPDRLARIQEASVGVAEVFDKVAMMIKQWGRDELKLWGFNEQYFDLLNMEWDDVFCMRIGWAWQDGNLRFMEINSEKPTFWMEPEMANGVLAKRYGLQNHSPQTPEYLRTALNQAIRKGIDSLDISKNASPRVGFVTRDNPWDIDTMRWLSTFCEFDSEVLGMEMLDFTKAANQPLNRQTGNMFDALIFWYPIEYLIDDKFLNGESVLKVFNAGLTTKSFAVVHAIPAFFIQPKSILAFITENADKIFAGRLKAYKSYFPVTYLTPDKFGDTYFAKPIWGREGKGCYLMDNGTIIHGRYQEDYFSRQKKVYQEALSLDKITVAGQEIVIIHEAWVYRVGKKFVPGAVGIRGSNHVITDDSSYCIPIGV